MMEVLVILNILWAVVGMFISFAIACLINGLYSYNGFMDYMEQNSIFFGIERLLVWMWSGIVIGLIVSVFVHFNRWRELREQDPTVIQWKRSRELRRQDPSYNDIKTTNNDKMGSIFNAIMQLLGCIIGAYMSYKTGSALAFPMFYVPFSLAGLMLKGS